ncbi:uncharacterized protein UTRI_04185_B [Ustilago trichophora]|uniref:Uncharacterized protein n=1 Tax=Ustilago trichophora TaxID=86804 RepID=A0A5C3EC60_9BASI|nr:uncharacterized protein UTRI_04185_B [Ustilago trichophora]
MTHPTLPGLADESVVDARQTIDRTRKWLEQSSDAQRSALDLQLVGCPQFWGGPCNLAHYLLHLLTSLPAAKHCAQDLTTVAQNLVESLARAIDHIQAESQLRHAMLGLLGIVLDAFAELDWTAVVGVEKHDSVVSTAARLLIDMVWRKSCEIKIAVGILGRVARRGGSCGFAIAVVMAGAVVAKLNEELHDPFAGLAVSGAFPFNETKTLVERSLHTMLAIDELEAIRDIDTILVTPLSAMLGVLLERTSEDSANEHLIELEVAATQLYRWCYEAVHGPLA